MRKTMALTAGLLLLPALATAGALENLMPRPKEIVRREGTLAARFGEPVERVEASEALRKEKGEEAYKLWISPEGVAWAGNQRYALGTLDQLRALSAVGEPLPCCEITDWPTFGLRGMLHDTGRNWQPIAMLRMQLAVLSAYKFNCFQWHITDNHGWRLQSRKYPQLSRPSHLERSTRTYSQKEFTDLIAYAHSLGITVIPELDVPGHTRMFRHAFGLKRMDDPRVCQIVADLFGELMDLLDPAVTPYIHIGSDEVQAHEQVPGEWLTYWVNLIEARGFKVVAWGPGQTPPNLSHPLIRQYWQGHQVKRKDEPYIDSQHSCYINHVDPLEILAAAAYQQPCFTGAPANRLGAIFAVWHDDAVAKPMDVLTMNPVFPAIVLYADTFWNGRENKPRYYANLPPPGDPDFALAEDLERRLLAHKPLFEKEQPFPYWRQTQLRWRMAETDEARPFSELPWGERVIAQGTIYPQHFFYPKTNLTDGKSGCVYLGMVVNSDRRKTVPLYADFMNYSRSEGRKRDAALVQGAWNAKGAELWLNGKRVPPPVWKQPGLSGPASVEKPMVDEAWCVRPPVRVTLEKGRNELLIRLPKQGWKWSATCFFPDDAGLTFEPPERQ